MVAVFCDYPNLQQFKLDFQYDLSQIDTQFSKLNNAVNTQKQYRSNKVGVGSNSYSLLLLKLIDYKLWFILFMNLLIYLIQ